MLDPRRLRFAMCASLLAMPVLVLDNLPTRSNSAEAVETSSDELSTDSTVASTTSTTVRVTTTTAPPATTAPPTTAAPTTTAPPRTTTTAAPRVTAPPTTAPAAPAIQPVAPPTDAPATPDAPAAPTDPAPPAANTEAGKATWYHWNPGECAHKTIPKGTVVTITRVSTGATTTCTVTDRGPYGAGRIIDLDATVFDDLATLGAGVIDVVITW